MATSEDIPAIFSYSIVIPCYNEENSIAETLHAIELSTPSNAKCEIIAVDDGSTDGTLQRLSSYTTTLPLIIVHLPENLGYGAALKAGIKQSRYELIAIIDCDGSYPAEEIFNLVTLIQGNEMVVGARNEWGTHYPVTRRVPKAILKGYASLLVGFPIPDVNSGLRVFRRETAEKFLSVLPNSFSFTLTITLCCLMNGCSVLYVPIDYKPRIGFSKIRPVRDTILFTKLICRTGILFAPQRFLVPVCVFSLCVTLVSVVSDLFEHRYFSSQTVFVLLATINAIISSALVYRLTKGRSLQRGRVAVVKVYDKNKQRVLANN